MNLINYIISFLNDVNNVTIPSFGVFELNMISAVTEGKETAPPKYEVSFSQQHDLNNDNIIKLISSFEKKKQTEIKKELDFVISNWKDILKIKGTLHLPKLGILSSNKERITFVMEEDCIFNHKNFGLPILNN